MTLTSFNITRLDLGRLVAFAFVCPDLKYVGMLVKRLNGIARRTGDEALWRDIAHELHVGFSPRVPVPAGAAIVRLLVREEFRKDTALQYVHTETLPNGPRKLRYPGADQRWLDDRLHQCQPWTSLYNVAVRS